MSRREIAVRTIVLAGAGIAATIVLVVVAVFLLMRHWGLPGNVDNVRLPYPLVIDGPGLQSAPQQDLAAYRAEKQRQLDAVGWADVAQGTARIPVTAAMDLLLARAAATGERP